MTLIKQWRRDLYPAEKRVNFKQLGEQWNTMEVTLVDALTPILNQALVKLEADVAIILESGKLEGLLDLKIGYKDKLVNIVRQSLYEAYKVGKTGVHAEFNINKDLKVDGDMGEYFRVKAEAVISDIFNKVKTTTVFTVLAGVRANKTAQQILNDIRGNTKEGA